jgi:hypothetical protein
LIRFELPRTNKFSPVSCDQFLLHGHYPQSAYFRE